jgi:hypothetical protein
MDGTIIGDTSFQTCKYDICNSIKVKFAINDIGYCVGNGIVRPYFESFIKTMKLKYPNAEFFVYTAAEMHWANTMIKAVEQTIGIKFSRPIFSRKSCLQYGKDVKKSLARVLPTIYKKLKTKYPIENINDIHKNTILIDNNNVVTPMDIDRFVKCSTYSHTCVMDVLSNIPLRKIHENIEIIKRILLRYGLLNKGMQEEKNINRIMGNYYALLGECYRNASYQQVGDDKFWHTMERVFRHHQINSLNKKVVAYLKKNANKYNSTI